MLGVNKKKKMKNKFIGYYKPDKEEIEEAWNNGNFAFDANTLLNLYRYTEETRNDFILVLKKIKENLFLPYQAAYEYHENRLGVIEGIEKSYENISSIFNDNFDANLRDQLNGYKKHPSILIGEIINIHKKFLKELEKELDKQKAKHPNFKTEDSVLKDITELFAKSVGEEFSKDDLAKIYTEGKERYANEVPPGYKDLNSKKNKDQRNLYGDLIIWKELINYSKNKKISLIFITDDRKDDWSTIEKGRTIRPREELIKEFFDFTGIRILIYNADQFLTFAKERGLLPELKSETIEEVKDIRVLDEKNYSLSEALGSQVQRQKSISEILFENEKGRINWSDIYSYQPKHSNSISDILNDPLRVPKLYNSQYTPERIPGFFGNPLNSQLSISDLLTEFEKQKESIKEIKVEDETKSRLAKKNEEPSGKEHKTK